MTLLPIRRTVSEVYFWLFFHFLIALESNESGMSCFPLIPVQSENQKKPNDLIAFGIAVDINPVHS